MRRVLAALLCSGLLAGCGLVEERVADAVERADGVVGTVRWCTSAARLSNAVARRDVDAAQGAAMELQDAAPDALTADVTLLLDAAERAVAGELEAFGAPRAAAALERVSSAVSERCDPL